VTVAVAAVLVLGVWPAWALELSTATAASLFGQGLEIIGLR
jgi:hypothetical protein